MSDYKRFVSYLYEYIAEKKSENRGFVKVELRSGICRMQFQLNVFSLPSQTPVTVYGFIQIEQLFSGLRNVQVGIDWAEWEFRPIGCHKISDSMQSGSVR